ncbi:MAG: flagellar hook-basal body complex protein, partial [Patescibacteria group bacterium]
MSLYAALTVAVGGLAAQSASIGNISDNLANAQTTGFKGIETKFESLVTQSNQFENDPGGVRATPHYTNDVQGNLVQSSSSTSLAISGQG